MATPLCMTFQALYKTVRIANGDSNWCYGLEMHEVGKKFVLTSVTLTFCMDITFVNGNYSWKFHICMDITQW